MDDVSCPQKAAGGQLSGYMPELPQDAWWGTSRSAGMLVNWKYWIDPSTGPLSAEYHSSEFCPQLPGNTDRALERNKN